VSHANGGGHDIPLGLGSMENFVSWSKVKLVSTIITVLNLVFKKQHFKSILNAFLGKIALSSQDGLPIILNILQFSACSIKSVNSITIISSKYHIDDILPTPKCCYTSHVAVMLQLWQNIHAL